MRVLTAGLIAIAVAGLTRGLAGQGPAPPSLDHGFYKARVQPTFMVKKPGMISCMNCHRRDDRGWPLQMPPAGVTTFSEEQSEHNYYVTLAWVQAGNPGQSRLLTKPLARAAGGDAFHGGGKAWASQDDPEYPDPRGVGQRRPPARQSALSRGAPAARHSTRERLAIAWRAISTQHAQTCATLALASVRAAADRRQ